MYGEHSELLADQDPILWLARGNPALPSLCLLPLVAWWWTHPSTLGAVRGVGSW